MRRSSSRPAGQQGHGMKSRCSRPTESWESRSGEQGGVRGADRVAAGSSRGRVSRYMSVINYSTQKIGPAWFTFYFPWVKNDGISSESYGRCMVRKNIPAVSGSNTCNPSGACPPYFPEHKHIVGNFHGQPAMGNVSAFEQLTYSCKWNGVLLNSLF